LRRLDKDAKWATNHRDRVAQHRTLDALQLTSLSTVQSAHDEHRNSKHRKKAANETIFAESLGIFAEGVAREDVGDEAEAAVVEAAAKTVLPLSHFGSNEVWSQRVERRMKLFGAAARRNVIVGRQKGPKRADFVAKGNNPRPLSQDMKIYRQPRKTE